MVGLFEVCAHPTQEGAGFVDAARGLEIGKSEGKHGAMQGERGELALQERFGRVEGEELNVAHPGPAF